MAESHVPDHLPEDLDEGAEEPRAPYKNLLVPLVVVPALIVMVLVVIVALFGAIAGDEATPQENLQRMLHGTANERDQAAVLLVNQLLEHFEAVAAGEDPTWEIDATFLPELRRAWESADPEDVEFRYVFASLRAWLDDEAAVADLCSLLALDDELDPDARIRFVSLIALGGLGRRMDEPQRAYAVARIAPILEGRDGQGGSDHGLRAAAAIALQTYPGEEAREALRSGLRDGQLVVRGNAALALAALGDPAAAEVLRELIDPSTYEVERQRDPRVWTKGERISDSRQRAVRALAALGRPEDLEVLREVAADDEDLNVRAVALEVLSDRGEAAG